LNIAEGSTKRSKKEFLHYLNISYGSAKEVQVLIELCKDLGFLKTTDYTSLSSKIDHVNSKLFLFLRNIEERIQDRRSQFFKKFNE